MFQKITLILLLLAIVSCKNSESNEKDKIKAASWLLGNWENNSVDGNLEETWKKINDSTFQAQSYFIKEKDTLHFETITLQQKGEELTYNAAVKGQNDDKPVSFKLTTATEKELVFENSKHDYPQKISYTQITADSLVAKISGIQQGKPSSENYSMKKIK
ncbi:DUF6265 family protein [Flavobacterium gawalongense]|uniref:DUF6265 domain-containing protein n=1 Tax=Flavobacterium gawalongense TaxID=2594432 RepID=A0A553BCJ8_9FLAO|nr:DUF6265 family protein [Flavobacterium gawalongense]TRX00978.1 hypothetical protein FNW33_10950 [Flavobacterium gawalongense]TRX05483.1 hypothetical protein FNW12_10520 [Flavobacterium gawalongense]TRX05973.1 hypothetical protein FNW11_15135 [Flavobacterium gawalongense]TRX07082.1 hypothetical protein FNW10_15015 [Flavobacterium gawalongense]TRX23201.1 hypothetical protein FNW38_15150 [Flavobacterium gawalongense]